MYQGESPGGFASLRRERYVIRIIVWVTNEIWSWLGKNLIHVALELVTLSKPTKMSLLRS